MANRKDLEAMLDRLNAAPHDDDVRSGADAALAEIDDADLLADVMQQFIVELPVAQAIERRLNALGSENSRAWARVARALSSYADNAGLQEHALSLLRRALTANPNNLEALDAAIMQCSLMREPPHDDLSAWSARYAELAPQDVRALSARAKVLFKLEGPHAALDFLRASITREHSEKYLTGALQSLIERIEAGESVLQQWP